MPPLNRLGDWLFCSLTGQVVPAAERPEVIVRPGVPGILTWHTGARGEPFTLRSFVDQISLDWARYTAETYQLAPAAGAWRLVTDGFDWDTFGQRFVVLKVTPIRVQNALTVGGLANPSLAIVEADWTLIAQEIGA